MNPILSKDNLYTQLKSAEIKLKELETKIKSCNHHFYYNKESKVFKTDVYSKLDGINVEGPSLYGFIETRECYTCGLTQVSESKHPGENTEWKNK